MRNDFCSDYLAHSAKGTSWTKKDHKWIERIKKNGKWVYYYKITGQGYKDKAENEEKQRLQSEVLKRSAASSHERTKGWSREFAGKSKEMRDTYKLNLSNGNYNKTVREIGIGASINKGHSVTWGHRASDQARNAEKNAREEAYHRKERDKARKNYETKSLAGRIEAGYKKIKKLLG